jgi:hypothetical protein
LAKPPAVFDSVLHDHNCIHQVVFSRNSSISFNLIRGSDVPKRMRVAFLIFLLVRASSQTEPQARDTRRMGAVLETLSE